MHSILALTDSIETIAAIIGVCAVFATLFIIVNNHSSNDKKHLKEGEQPMTLPMCDQVHKGWQNCIKILSDAAEKNEERSAEAVRELKMDMNRQFEQVLASVRCLESKLLQKGLKEDARG